MKGNPLQSLHITSALECKQLGGKFNNQLNWKPHMMGKIISMAQPSGIGEFAHSVQPHASSCNTY